MTFFWLVLLLACATPLILWLLLALWIRILDRKDP